MAVMVQGVPFKHLRHLTFQLLRRTLWFNSYALNLMPLANLYPECLSFTYLTLMVKVFFSSDFLRPLKNMQ